MRVRAPTQPPRVIDRVIGRDADLDALELEVARSPLVTVLGPPGVGKTRLAGELVRRLAERRDAVAMCDVTECANSDDVLVRVAGALGVATTEVASHLAARPQVLVIDNAEHITPEVAGCIAPWMEGAQELCIVVTSRARLRVPGEVVFDLAPLGDAAAAELFVERARKVRREPIGDDTRAIAELVRRLDGMPLAIELAAARSRLFEPAQLLAKLDQSLDLLAEGPPPARSLAAALELSYSLLAPVEQQALAQASVFRGGFTVEAADAVIDLGAGSVVDALEALADHSLVWTRRLGNERRLGLYLFVRDFAEVRLQPVAAEAARARHAAWYLRTGLRSLAAIPGPGAPAALARIAADSENLLAIHRRACTDPKEAALALDAALVLDPLLQKRGPIDHAIAIVDQALAVAPADHPRRLDALEARANAMRYTRLGDARAAYTELDAAATAAGSRLHHGRALSGKGVVGWLLGDTARCEGDLEQALALQRELGDKLGESITRGSLGHIVMHRGDLAVAREHFSRALALVVELGDVRHEGIHQGNLGLVEQECGRLLVARTAFERSLDVFRALDDRRSEAWALSNLAGLAQEEGRLDEARALYKETLVRHAEVGNKRSQGLVLAHLAHLAQWDGALEDAREGYERALGALDASGAATTHALAGIGLAAVLADLGLKDAARAMFDRAETQLRASNDHTGLAALEVTRGHLDLALGNPEAARRRLVEALANIDRWTVRFARIGLERALSRAAPPPAANPAFDTALVIGPDARWFRAPGGGKVDLSRRRPLRLILGLLSSARRERPGAPLAVEGLLEGGWPGEIVLPEAGASRVYVAVSTLRRMGLRDVLQRVDAGYLIDPNTPVFTQTEEN
jgi:predicted ATPase